MIKIFLSEWRRADKGDRIDIVILAGTLAGLMIFFVHVTLNLVVVG